MATDLYNPIQSDYDDKLKAIAEELGSLEKAGGTTPSKDEENAILRAKGVLGSPATATTFTNKTTPKQAIAGAGNKIVGALKKRSAIIGLVAILGSAATFPFLGSLSLPFALIGNLNMQSVMQGAAQYMEDYMGFKIFGMADKTSVAFKDDKMVGLTGAQIDELKKNGVTLNGPNKTKTGKTVFDSIEVDGKTATNATEFHTIMRENPSLRSKVIISKPSLWKSAKSTVAKTFLSKNKVNVNPEIKEGTPEEQKKQILQDAIEGDTAKASVSEAPNDGKEESTKQQQDATKNNANGVASEFSDEVAAAEKAVSEGLETPNPVEMDNIPKLLEMDGQPKLSATGIAKAAWGFVNPLDIGDAMCSAYQVADTANMLARVVVTANLVRLALSFKASVEKIMAGDGDPAVITQYMDSLNTPNPTTGESFDQSAAAQMVFSNMVSAEPMALTALGGSAMLMLYGGMRSINTFIGGGSAGHGRAAIKNTCKVVQNLGVQVFATAGSMVLAFFSGGTSLGAQTGIKASLKVAKDLAIKTIKDFWTNLAKDIAEKGVSTLIKDLSKTAAKKALSSSWTFIKKTSKETVKNPALMFGLTLTAVETFAMGYIVNAMTGGNIADSLSNGTSLMSGIVTGSNVSDYKVAVGSGSVVTDTPTATAYMNDEYRSYQQSYVAYMQDQARDKPFDITNPYSAVGSVLANFRSVFGAGAFSSTASAMKSFASMPSLIPKLLTANAYASDGVDLQAVNDAVANPYYSENNIAVQITGTPLTIFNKTHTFAQIKQDLIDGPNPQIKYDGDDETTGEPKLSIIPGSKLEKYAAKCHNPDNTEIDEMFQEDAGSATAFDLSCTTFGRKKSSVKLASTGNQVSVKSGVILADGDTATAEEADEFDDGISFIYQLSPSPKSVQVTESSSSNSSGGISEVSPSEWAVSSTNNGSIDKNSADWEKWKAALGGNGVSSTGVLKPIAVSGSNICSQSNRLNQDGGGNLFNPNAANSAEALIKAYNAANSGKYLVPGACFRAISAQVGAYERSGGRKNQATGEWSGGNGSAAKPGSSNHGWGLAIDFRISNTPTGQGDSITSFSSSDYLWLKNNGYQFGWVNPSAMQHPTCNPKPASCEPWHFQYVGKLTG